MQSRSASPFWKPPIRENAPTRSGTASAGRDPNFVVGAAYSHADMLKFDSLCAQTPSAETVRQASVLFAPRTLLADSHM